MSFSSLDLLPSIQGTLAAQGLHTATPVQARAIPALLERKSVVAVAETGSGKTLAYALPLLDRLKRLELDGNAVEEGAAPRALVVVPTRELGEQVARVFKGFTHDTRLRVRSVLGGQKNKQNRESVAGPFEVLVATPGRLARLTAGGQLHLHSVRFLVLDEADALLDQGFLSTIMELVEACPSTLQVALCSATMSPKVRQLVGRAFRDALLVETEGSERLVPTLRTRTVEVPEGDRAAALLRLVAEPVEGGTLLFANTRAQCDRVVAWLQAEGHRVAVQRGELDPVERRDHLRAFRAGEVDLLVCTDAGARGLDVPHVGRVINVFLPRERENYLHRAGRTARAGRAGTVVNLVTPRDRAGLAALGASAAEPEGGAARRGR